jgi:hypothetical protein
MNLFHTFSFTKSNINLEDQLNFGHAQAWARSCASRH